METLHQFAERIGARVVPREDGTRALRRRGKLVPYIAEYDTETVDGAPRPVVDADGEPVGSFVEGVRPRYNLRPAHRGSP